MKILIFIFSIITTPLFSQSSTIFHPYWEFGMQYNIEGNSAFKSYDPDITSSNPDRYASVHQANLGYSCTVNAKLNLSNNFAVLCYLGFGIRNFSNVSPRFSISSTGVAIATNLKQEITYNVIEFASGISFQPNFSKKLCFAVGLGISKTNNYDVRAKLEGNSGALFIKNDFFSAFPILAFITSNYTLKETKSARLFIEPHFKMDILQRDKDSGKQQHYTFGIGIGGNVKIGN